MVKNNLDNQKTLKKATPNSPFFNKTSSGIFFNISEFNKNNLFDNELLEPLLPLVIELNQKTGWGKCNTGIDILYDSLKEVKLAELTPEETNSIKQGILPIENDSNNSFYPILI